MNTENAFARQLRLLREENHLTQEQLRMKLETQGYEIFSKSTISRWENGSRKPKIEIIEDLEDILGANRGVLLRAAGYLVEQSPDQPVASQIDPIVVKRRDEHFTKLANTAKSLLDNDLYSVVPRGWTTNRIPSSGKQNGSRQVRYILSRKSGVGDYYELTNEQLSDQLQKNVYFTMHKDERFFRDCFMPHLKSELPEELKTELFFVVVEEQPYQLINTLRVLAARKIFKGTCPVCKDWR